MAEAECCGQEFDSDMHSEAKRPNVKLGIAEPFPRHRGKERNSPSGGQSGSMADRTMRKDVADAAREIVDTLIKNLR